jgi:oleandomycin transport system ATP-binding protein
VIFLDEPTTGLDPAKREDMWGVVRNLVGEGSTVLLTTQYLEEADALADEVTVIDRGRVIAHDTPLGLKRVVGGQTLTVQPLDPARLAEAAALLQQVSGHKAESPRTGVVSVAVKDDSALTETVMRLSAAGIGVTELSLHLPSLDEVFFTLVGRRVGDDSAGNGNGASNGNGTDTSTDTSTDTGTGTGDEPTDRDASSSTPVSV